MNDDNLLKNTNNNQPTEVAPHYRARHRRRIIRSFELEAIHKRTFPEKIADSLTAWSGSLWFVALHGILFLAWIVINLNLIKGIKAFDPFPFGLLTMIVSLEAIFLSIFVLMSQNRESKTNDLREEVDLQVNLIAEEEITKIINILAKIYRHLNIPEEKDAELEWMMKPLNTKEIEEELKQQLNIKY